MTNTQHNGDAAAKANSSIFPRRLFSQLASQQTIVPDLESMSASNSADASSALATGMTQMFHVVGDCGNNSYFFVPSKQRQCTHARFAWRVSDTWNSHLGHLAFCGFIVWNNPGIRGGLLKASQSYIWKKLKTWKIWSWLGDFGKPKSKSPVRTSAPERGPRCQTRMAFEPGQDTPFAAIGNTLNTHWKHIGNTWSECSSHFSSHWGRRWWIYIYIYEKKNLYEPISYLKQFAIGLSIHNCSVTSPKKLN